MKIKDIVVETNPSREGQMNKFKQRIFFFPHNESVWENMVKRNVRPYKLYKEELIPMLIKNLKTENKKVYKLLKDVKWSWKQKCGCDCGCSPGFIGEPTDNQYVDITVSYKL